MSLLKSHMDAIESHLVAISQIPANSGHPLHKGTPREAFIKEYLQNHIPSNVAVGTGEIIDANSRAGEARNQFDIVIYKRNYPKLDFGGGISGFLIESVIATIEVKSVLNQNGIEQAVNAANNIKRLTPNLSGGIRTGWIPPKPLNYVVAYDGPVQISTAHGWILNSHQQNAIPLPTWNNQNRLNIAGTALDGIFILNKGFITINNTPLTLVGDNLNGIYTLSDTINGNILMLFLLIQNACSNLEGMWLNPIPYIAADQYPNVRTI